VTRRWTIATLKLKSGFEKKVAKYLNENKIPFEYETLRVPYLVPEKKRNYNPDFMLPNGIIVEAKGKLDRLVREKMALVIEQNPELDIRFLFMRDNKIAKNSKTRYSDWCKKRGIKYAISEEGHIPSEWMAEARVTSSLDGIASVQPASKRKVRAGVRTTRSSLDISSS
jgi:hypothetical protein